MQTWTVTLLMQRVPDAGGYRWLDPERLDNVPDRHFQETFVTLDVDAYTQRQAEALAIRAMLRHYAGADGYLFTVVDE